MKMLNETFLNEALFSGWSLFSSADFSLAAGKMRKNNLPQAASI
jgi:hypothetical protein